MDEDKEYNECLGRRIRQVREDMNLNRDKFSERCDISPSFLADVENGKKGIGARNIYKICEATNISASYFIQGNDQSIEIEAACEMLNKLSKEERLPLLNIMREYVDAINKIKSQDDDNVR